MRNASTPAVQWAVHSSADTINSIRFLDHRLGDLERAALTAVPDYLAEVDAIALGLRDRVKGLRQEHLDRAGSVSPAAAEHLRMPGRRLLCLHLSWFTATIGMAFYWTRSAIDPRSVVGWTLGLLVASLVFGLLAHLPLRRSRPPFSGVVFLAWLTVVLGIAGMGPAHAYLALLDAAGSHRASLTLGWIVVAALAVLAGAVTRAHLWLTKAQRRAQDAEVTGFRGRLGADTTEALVEAGARVRSLWGALPDADRDRVLADIDAAHALLVERRVLKVGATTEVPGLRVLDSGALTEASLIGALGVVPLAPTGPNRYPAAMS